MNGSFRAVRVGAAAALEVLGIRSHDVWPSVINPPAAIFRPLSGSFDETFSGAVTYQAELTVLLQLGKQETAQEQLDMYLETTLAGAGSMSVKEALEADQSLGGAADSVLVKGWRDYGSMVIGATPDGRGPEYLGVKFDVEVLA